MNNSNQVLKRKVFGRLSILAGNTLQIAGIAAAYLALAAARSQRFTATGCDPDSDTVRDGAVEAQTHLRLSNEGLCERRDVRERAK